MAASVLFSPSEKLCITITQLACQSPRIHVQSAVAGIGTNTPGCVRKTIKRRVQPSYIVCSPESLYALRHADSKHKVHVEKEEDNVQGIHRPCESGLAFSWETQDPCPQDLPQSRKDRWKPSARDDARDIGWKIRGSLANCTACCRKNHSWMGQKDNQKRFGVAVSHCLSRRNNLERRRGK